MMNSIRERIVQAVLEKLRPVATLHGATLHRQPAIAITREQCPALVVFPESDAITDHANDRVVRELTLRVVALTRVVVSPAAPDAPETLADALLSSAHAALFMDVNLDALALGIRELGADWEVEDADATAVAIPARYAITYRTLTNDITQKG